MKYEKAKIIAKNLPSGSYAAGCPSNSRGRACLLMDRTQGCKNCERSK